jgi:hypothetical protein
MAIAFVHQYLKEAGATGPVTASVR